MNDSARKRFFYSMDAIVHVGVTTCSGCPSELSRRANDTDACVKNIFVRLYGMVEKTTPVFFSKAMNRGEGHGDMFLYGLP